MKHETLQKLIIIKYNNLLHNLK